MKNDTTWRRAKGLALALMVGGISLVTTASCDPYGRTIDIYRNDDDCGVFDFLCDHGCPFWDDDCYDDQIIIFD